MTKLSILKPTRPEVGGLIPICIPPMPCSGKGFETLFPADNQTSVWLPSEAAAAVLRRGKKQMKEFYLEDFFIF